MVTSHRVAILMASYNGLAFLPDQLDSILEQTYPHWRLWVSDDGSTDGTLDLLRDTRENWGSERLRMVHGPAAGFAKNFLTLVCREDLQAEYYAYADQDDVWFREKLARAVSVLTRQNPSVPALYCGRTELIDRTGRPMGYSQYARVKPSFHNAVLQNIASGNTMVFNEAARRLLMISGAQIEVFAHDWWTYLATMAGGGVVHFDPQPMVQYRQHPGNNIGANDSLGAAFKRVGRDIRGDLRKIVNQHADALLKLQPYISEYHLEQVDSLLNARHFNFTRRLGFFLTHGFRRQSVKGNCSLALAVALNRL